MKIESVVYTGFTNSTGTIKYLTLTNNMLFSNVHKLRLKDSVTLEFEDGLVHFFLPGTDFPGEKYYFILRTAGASGGLEPFYTDFVPQHALDLFYVKNEENYSYTPLLPNCSVERKPK